MSVARSIKGNFHQNSWGNHEGSCLGFSMQSCSFLISEAVQLFIMGHPDDSAPLSGRICSSWNDPSHFDAIQHWWKIIGHFYFHCLYWWNMYQLLQIDICANVHETYSVYCSHKLKDEVFWLNVFVWISSFINENSKNILYKIKGTTFLWYISGLRSNCY